MLEHTREFRGECADKRAGARIWYDPAQGALAWRAEWDMPGIIHGRAGAETAEKARELIEDKCPGQWKWWHVRLAPVQLPLDEDKE